MSDLDDLLEQQAGTVSRTQLAGLEIARRVRDTMLRRRELVPVLPGVYVNHTGKPSREQRVIAAVLYAGHSALHLDTALDHPKSNGLIHVAIDASRRVRRQRGIRIHRVVDLDEKVRWNLTPPRVRPELAAIELAHRATTTWMPSRLSLESSVPGGRRRRDSPRPWLTVRGSVVGLS